MTLSPSTSPNDKISNQPQALSREAQLLVMGNLPKGIQVSMISDKAAGQSLDWLETMVQGGVLDVADELKSVTSHPEMRKVCDDWSARAIALTDFMDGIKLQPISADPRFGDLDEPLSKAVLPTTTQFKAFFVAATDFLTSAYSELISDIDFGDWAKFSGMDDVREHRCSSAGLAMGRWMAAACALDLPQTVRKISISCPLAHRVTFAYLSLGEDLEKCRVSANSVWPLLNPKLDDLQVTPYFVALQMSSLACMTALTDCTLSGPPRLGTVRFRDAISPFEPITMHKYVSLACEPQALAHALEPIMRSPGMQDQVHQAALQSMRAKDHQMRPYVGAYLAAGAFDVNPMASVKRAVEQGFPKVIKHFEGRMPWADLEGEGIDFTDPCMSPLYQAVLNSDTENNKQFYEDAIVELIHQAERDNKTGLVLPTFISTSPCEPSVFEPLASFVEKGFAKAIVKYLDHGFDPHSKADVDSLSLLEQAQKKSPQIAHVIRSYEVRQKAMNILLEMELPGPPKAAP